MKWLKARSSWIWRFWYVAMNAFKNKTGEDLYSYMTWYFRDKWRKLSLLKFNWNPDEPTTMGKFAQFYFKNFGNKTSYLSNKPIVPPTQSSSLLNLTQSFHLAQTNQVAIIGVEHLLFPNTKQPCFYLTVRRFVPIGI
jgi:hypothetical protein